MLWQNHVTVMINIAPVTKTPTSTKTENAFMKMASGTLSMRNIKKIKLDANLETDRTGHKTGKIYLKRLSENFSTDELKSYFIKFENDSRSRIHLHDSDQIIVGISGVGRLVVFSKIKDEQKNTTLEIEKSLNFEQGEAVLIPAGRLHWHGAADGHNSSQMSFMKNGKTFWF